MTKMEFAAKVAEQIDGGEVKVKECANGQKKVGIVVNDGSNIAPCVYIEEAYDRNQTVEDTAKEIKDFVGTLVKPKIDMSGIMDFEKTKKNIRVALFNQVTTVPVSVSADAYGFDDLIICPYVRISDEATTKVTPSLIESWSVSEEDVIKAGIENMKKELTVMSMAEQLGLLMPNNVDMIPAGMPKMYVVGGGKTYGAGQMLAARERLSEIFPEGYTVIPSSIHECIVVDNDNIEAINMIINEVNTTQLKLEEVLGRHAYVFKGGE